MSHFSEGGVEMEGKLLNIGFGNTVVADRVVAIVSPGSAPMKRLKEDAKMGKKLIDATMGRRTRALKYCFKTIDYLPCVWRVLNDMGRF